MGITMNIGQKQDQIWSTSCPHLLGVEERKKPRMYVL